MKVKQQINGTFKSAVDLHKISKSHARVFLSKYSLMIFVLS